MTTVRSSTDVSSPDDILRVVQLTSEVVVLDADAEVLEVGDVVVQAVTHGDVLWVPLVGGVTAAVVKMNTNAMILLMFSKETRERSTEAGIVMSSADGP